MEAHRHLPNGGERSGGDAGDGTAGHTSFPHGSLIRARRRAVINPHEQSYHVLDAKHEKPQSVPRHSFEVCPLDFASRQTFCTEPLRVERRSTLCTKSLWMLPGGCCWNRDKHGSMPASALQNGSSPGGSLSIQPQRPKVGVGVLIMSGSSVLLGKRRGSAGSGTWATPGGHLEFGESWAQCAVREVQEETGLTVTDVRLGTVLNVVDEPTGYHYVTIFMVATAPADAEPVNAEPDKCEGWHWCDWSADLPAPLFKTLKTLRAAGFDPLLSPRSPDAADDAILEAAAEGLRALCDAAGIDESHGVKHARRVLAHAEQALPRRPQP